MATKLNKEIIALLSSDDSTKVLATVNEQGYPHAAVKPFIRVDDDGNLLYLELVESFADPEEPGSQHLVRSEGVRIHERHGAAELADKGKPVKTLITGPVFLHHYRDVRQRLGDVGLSAVWVIEPEEIINENIVVRYAEEQQAHPVFRHLDRLAKVLP